MTKTIEFLAPQRKLVDEVADWLCGLGKYAGRVRQNEGAASLGHVMVIVPTAQSGRSLRLALARRFPGKGVIPPRIVLPIQIVKSANLLWQEASSTEIAAAFQQFAKENRDSLLALDCLVRPEEYEDLTARFALLDQLEDIWRILAGRGLLMRDVVGLAGDWLETELGDEKRRWEQLGALETNFFDYLHAHGLAYPTELVHAAKSQAEIVDRDIEEIVLPALADPVRVLEDVLKQQISAGKKVTVLLHAAEAEQTRFDEWGRPVTAFWTADSRPVLDRLTDADIVCTANATALSERVANDFPALEDDAALPALGLCDGELFDGLAGAFLNRKYVVHNPERHRLAHSSLGRLVKNLMALYAADEMPWREFVAFFRSDDVQTALKLEECSRARALEGLDIAQNAYVPTLIPAGFAFPENPDLLKPQQEALDFFLAKGREAEALLFEAKRNSSLVRFLRSMLKSVFASHTLSGGASEKEFRAAADAVRDFLNGLEGDFIAGLPMTASEFAALARRELDVAVYSLEPDASDVIRTEGWLELTWSSADRIALAGFHEGKVPDSVVGHPFLPDSLRRKLGLVSNVDRLARDSWLFTELLASHAPHGVRAYVARASDDGDICRPSRLLYLCSDAQLPSRVDCLFGDLPEPQSKDRVRRVEWSLKLPDRVDLPTHFSPSAIDTYVKCPFNYLLKYGLRMKAFEDKRELEANDFGTLVHAALEAYARIQIKGGDDQLTDAASIRALIRDEIFPPLRARFGRTTLNIQLQLDAIEGRLMNFADVQAEWARQGWRIRATEHMVDVDVPELGFRVKGYVDRVDENIDPRAEKGFCVIDYKTWDKKSLTEKAHVHTSERRVNEKQLEFGRRMGYPLLTDRDGREKARMTSVQLPVYGKALAVSYEGFVFADSAYQYLVLGKTAEETGFMPLKDQQVLVAVETARRAVANIRSNLFWPPGPSGEWKWDFGGLFVTDPETDLAGMAWTEEQTKRLEARHV